MKDRANSFANLESLSLLIITHVSKHNQASESGILTLASGRPYTAVFDNPEVNFSIVPGEKFNSFRGPTFKDVDVSLSRIFRFGEPRAGRPVTLAVRLPHE
jgi:hypothetical protein